MSGVIGLVARREIVTRAQQRSYRIGLLVALGIAVVAVLLPSFFSGGGGHRSYDVAVVGSAGTLPAAIEAAGTAQGATITVHRASEQQARANVRSEKWDAALIDGSSIVAHHSGDAVVAIVQDAYALSETIDRLTRAGLTTAQAVAALDTSPLRVEATASSQDSQRQVIAIVTVVVLFSQLVTFCTWVATGVVEEKSSRVVELLLSSVRPVQLLTGKLLGIGVLAAAQVALLGGAAVLTASLAGTVTLPAADLATVAISFAAFLLGFAFFAAVSAALASTVSRQEEVSGILAPVTVSLTLCYVAAFTVATSGGTTVARVLSLVPPVSALAMPARIARGDATVLDLVLAVALLVAVTVAVMALAARIYRASILHTGSRLTLGQAWRGEAVSERS